MLRQVEERDLPVLAGMEEEIFSKSAWSLGVLQSELNAPARTYLVWDEEGDIRAYGGFWFNGEDAELLTLGVALAVRRRGLGRTLLSELIEQARKQGANRMFLEVRVDNDPALNLYRDMGFQQIGLRRRYYQPEGVDAYTMVKDLTERIGPVGGDRNDTGTESETDNE